MSESPLLSYVDETVCKVLYGLRVVCRGCIDYIDIYKLGRVICTIINIMCWETLSKYMWYIVSLLVIMKKLFHYSLQISHEGVWYSFTHYGCWFFLLSISDLKQYSWSIEMFTDVCFPLRIPLRLNQSCWGTTDVEHSSNKSVVGSFIPRRISYLHHARCLSVVDEFIIWCSMLSIQLE